ncbi:MAG: hypothetical protein NDI63_10245 [Pseudobdellovibrio sp.]|nr:hypothetical protein [Pseudobdellovibrio sp.]
MAFVNLRQNQGKITIKTGQEFLRELVHLERQTRQSFIQSDRVTSADFMKNWIAVVALMLRKISSITLGESDLDYEVQTPLFYFLNNKGNSNDH